MDSPAYVALALIALVSIIQALTAAAETAMERASGIRIHALAARGDLRARAIAPRVDQPRELVGPLTVARVFSSATIVALFAYVGARSFSPAAGVIGLGLAGGVYVAIIQMTVSILAARGPETVALRMARVVRWSRIVFFIPAAVLGLPSRIIARSLEAVTPDEENDILSLVEREEASGGVEEQEKRMIRGIIGLEDQTAREIMVPRIDIAAADVEDGIATVAALINERGYSRIPVYRENIDDVVGIVYAKDLLHAVTNGGGNQTLTQLLREPMFIPETKRLDQLLTEMRAARTHMAIVVDEYGGTAGLATIEDLLEEIVGEIEDEYDVAQPAMEVISDDEVVLDASAPTDVLRELFDQDVGSEEFDTVGGYLIDQLGRLPAVGDEVEAGALRLRVLSMSGRRLRRLRVTRLRAVEA
jgi:CBS domain containing-hemolysin-like protein